MEAPKQAHASATPIHGIQGSNPFTRGRIRNYEKVETKFHWDRGCVADQPQRAANPERTKTTAALDLEIISTFHPLRLMLRIQPRSAEMFVDM
jgi:hypothetical protein